MKNLIAAAMTTTALMACGGPASNVGGTTTSTDPNPPPSITPTGGAKLLAQGAYKAPASAAVRGLAAPVGPAMSTTMIMEAAGGMMMVLPNYDVVRGSMAVMPDGTLQMGVGNLLFHPDGTFEPATVVGTSNGTTITGTVNVTQTFSVAASADAQPVLLSQRVGTYVTTSSSDGLWLVLTLTAPCDPTAASPDTCGHLTGWAYSTQADAAAGDTSKAVRQIYSGGIQPTGPTGNAPAANNVFEIGIGWHDVAAGTTPPGVGGFAYFTTTGLVAITVNPVSGGEVVDVFAKQ